MTQLPKNALDDIALSWFAILATTYLGTYLRIFLYIE